MIPSLAAFVIGCGSSGGPPSQAIVGRILVTSAAENGVASEGFDVDLQPFTPPENPCAGATRTVGSCCFFAPHRVPTQPYGSGTPSTEQSAGAIQISNATTHATLGTFDFDSGKYDSLPASYPVGTWKPGDQLTVSATGSAIGPFTISGPALDPPGSVLPTTVVQGQDLVVTWTPDPASDTMSIGLGDGSGAVVACTVANAAGSVTIDASLFASLRKGPAGQVTAIRETERFTQTAGGRIELASFGWASRFCLVE